MPYAVTLPVTIKLPDESNEPTLVPLELKYSLVPLGVTLQPPEFEIDPEEPVVFWFKVGNVQLVNVPEAGVPNVGDCKTGEFDRTTDPEPVDVVTPVPPDATAKVADRPAASPVGPC